MPRQFHPFVLRVALPAVCIGVLVLCQCSFAGLVHPASTLYSALDAALVARTTPAPASKTAALTGVPGAVPDGSAVPADVPADAAAASELPGEAPDAASSPQVVDEGDGTAALVDVRGDVTARWAISTPVTWDNGDGTATTLDTSGVAATWPIPTGSVSVPALAMTMRSRGGALPAASGAARWPVSGPITTPFVPWHQGIDIACPTGTPIVAMADGTVISAGWDRTGYGNRVVVEHADGLQSTYNHLSRIAVHPGQALAAGEAAGWCGATGRATGPHLHFETLIRGRPINPMVMLP